MDCCRVGVRKSGSKRPIKFTLRSSDMVNQILIKAKILRTKEGYNSIYISLDRTVEERRAYKKVFEELHSKWITDSSKFNFIRLLVLIAVKTCRFNFAKHYIGGNLISFLIYPSMLYYVVLG